MSVTITASDVNKLRQMTGAGMMDCKKALTEAEGDFEKAIDILRKQGQKVAAKRADNTTSEGVVLTHVNDDHTQGILVALACETEPVSKVADFQNIANAILETAVTNNPADKDALLATTMTDGRTVGDAITELVGKIGEKLDIIGYAQIAGEQVTSYIHSTGKLGVLVSLINTNGTDVTEIGKDVAMQIAAMKPVAVDRTGVDSATVEREIEIGKEQARAEGKPEAMLEKIAVGKLEKFYKENTLLAQQFVKDNALTVAQLLDKTSKGMTVKEFKRVAIGG